MTRSKPVLSRLIEASAFALVLVTSGLARAGDAGAALPADSVTPRWSISLLEMLGRPTEDNVLKLFRTALDSEHGRLYVAGGS